MNKTSAKLLLAVVFFARGTSFLFSKKLMYDMSPLSVLAVRFIMAFLILAVIFNKKIRTCSKASLRGGLILGVMYTVCMTFEMYGLRLVDSGVCSLVENMAIVMVPIYVAIWTRTLPSRKTMVCAALAFVGVGFLSLTQTSDTGVFNVGLVLVFCAALTYAGCVIATQKVSTEGDPVTIGMIQLGVMGILSLVMAVCTGSFGMPGSGAQWAELLMLVLVCSCFGFTFQPVGQKYVPAETAAVFSVVNPLTASVMGIVIAGEDMSLLKFIGYLLIIIALFVYNFNLKKDKV